MSLISEEQQYIDPLSERKDLPKDPIRLLWQRFLFRARTRDTILAILKKEDKIVTKGLVRMGKQNYRLHS